MTRNELLEFEKIERERARRSGREDIIAFARSLGFTPDAAAQRRVLRSTSRRILLNASRQWGKSTTAALKALHVAYYTPNALVLIIAPSERQSLELFRKVCTFLRALPVASRLIEENKHTVEFENGARIVALPCSEDTIRGFSSVTLVILDEAGDLSEDIFTAIYPMILRSKGSILMQGTPKGRRGLFFNEWVRGAEDWERHEVTWRECPWITEEEIAKARKLLGPLFEQEYECKFITSGKGLVYSGFDEDVNLIKELPLGPDLKPYPWQYLLGLDFGVINGTAFTIGAWRPNDPTLYIVESYKEHGYSPTEAAQEVRELEGEYHFTQISADTGGLGKAFTQEMIQRYQLPIEAANKRNKVGHISVLNGELRQGRAKIVAPHCRPLIEEIQHLSWVDRGEGAKEDPAAPNDCADSFLYCWHASTAHFEREPEVLSVDPEDHIRAWTKEYWQRQEQKEQDRTQTERYLFGDRY
jgi:Terminase RNaseH-like domain/Terminase large subunit, T4likevirus-type, N-terminal